MILLTYSRQDILDIAAGGAFELLVIALIIFLFASIGWWARGKYDSKKAKEKFKL